jgi:hypothetical protein
VELTLTRKIFTDISTVGELDINGTFECYTLEDKVREEKIAGKTAIPMGRYKVDITHSPRFNCDMPLLFDVPNFKGVRIHTGNVADHTEGCLLVGTSKSDNRITGSKAAYAALFAKLKKAKDRGESIHITIKSGEPDRLTFDGEFLTWYRGGEEWESWPAVSGRTGFQDQAFANISGKGPLPRGKWLVKQTSYQKMPDRSWIEMIAAELSRTAWPGGESAWGKHRVWLQPMQGTVTHGRSGFSIHGGDTPGSAGCIDLTIHMNDFVSVFLSYGKDVVLTVE